MSRFNKEFFGGNSPSHDALVSMTIDNYDGIIHRIMPKILKNQNKNSVVNVFLCPKNGRPTWCTSDFQTAFRVDPVCLRATESHPSSLVYSPIGELHLPRELRLCSKTTWDRYESTPEDIGTQLNDLCESVELEEGFFFFHWGEICVKSNIVDGKYIHSVLPYYEHMIRLVTPFLESYEVDWEAEAICKRDTGFIIGYADLLSDFKLNVVREVIINDAETWRISNEDLNLRLVAEAKPKPTSWGSPHRQLKTYMDLLKKPQGLNRLPTAGIISTFSKAPPKIHKILEKDNIFIIRFTKSGEISDGVSPEQARL